MARNTLVLFSILSCFGTVWSTPGAAERWQVTKIKTDEPVQEIRQTGPDAAAVRMGDNWYRVKRCGATFCLSATVKPPRTRAPKDALPDGLVAEAAGLDIRRAWYAQPTTRYDHGILGDRIEAGSLEVADSGRRRSRIVLPRSSVFEDLKPRVADLNGDGRAEVVTIKSYLDRGGSLAVYGLKGSALRRLAQTPPIGRANRWLNVAGIADFDGNGGREIAIVVTPHIGGTLEFWSYTGARLRRIAAAAGFSNHAIGSRNLGLSAVADIDGDGRADLAVPDDSRRRLKLVGLRNGRVSILATIDLPDRVSHDIAVIADTSGAVFLAGLDNGQVVAVHRR